MSDKIGRGADPFPFMELPIEIRLMVYGEHFLQPKEVSQILPPIWDGGECMVAQFAHSVPLQMLFRVSKGVHEEAVPLYFRIKPFRFSSLMTLVKFLENAGRVCFQNLTSITFTYQGWYAAKAFKGLGECLALESVSIVANTCTPAYDAASGKRLLMKSAGMKDLLQIRGIKKLEIELQEYFGFRRTTGSSYVIAPDEERFVDALQVLKQPQDPAKIKRLLANLTPKEKAQGSVFGKANVITRAERKPIGGAKCVKRRTSTPFVSYIPTSQL